MINNYLISDLSFLRVQNDKMPVYPPGDSIAGYAEEKRILPADTPFPGIWNNSKTPYLVEIMENMGPFSIIQHQAVMKGAQLGYTAGAENIIAYWMDENPTAIMILSATDDLLLEWGDKRLEPLIDSCEFREKIFAQTENPKSRKSGDKTKSKSFAGGFLLMVSAQSPGRQRTMSIRVMIRDEIDGAPKYLTSGEGNWLAVSEARTNAWDHRKKIFDLSTPKLAHESNIKEAYELGDQRKYQIKCPHCKKEQFLEFGSDKTKHGLKAIHNDKDQIIDAYYSCINESCLEKIYNYHKLSFMQPEDGAKWVPTSISQSDTYRSYHMSSLYSPVGMLHWRELAEKWKTGRETSDGMRSFKNLYMGMPFADTGERPDTAKVIKLRGTYESGMVPDDVLFLTMAIDVQRGSENDPNNPARIELEVLGHGAGFRTSSIVYHTIRGEVNDPNSGAWEKLKEWAEEGNLSYKRKDGFDFDVQLIFIDSQDPWSMNAVYQFSSFWGNTFPIKGYGGRDGGMLMKRKNEEGDQVTRSNFRRYRLSKSGSKSGGIGFFEISTNYYKHKLYHNLTIEREESGIQKAGFCNFPIDYDGKYFDMLTSEEKMSNGSFHAGGRRNEALDCRVYNMCAGDVYLDNLVGDYKAHAKNNGASALELMDINHNYVLQDLKNKILPDLV